MRIKLPRDVSGEELVKAMKSALSKIDNCEVSEETYRYEPNFLGKILDIYQLRVWQTAMVAKGLFRKRQVRERTNLYFDAMVIRNDSRYQEINVNVLGPYLLVMPGGAMWIDEDIERTPKFRHIEQLLEEFWRNVFRNLQ